jgi:hypothetical protein
MDLCWGHPVHMQYHYHSYSWKCFPNQGNANEHSPQFGIALDGFGVFGPRPVICCQAVGHTQAAGVGAHLGEKRQNIRLDMNR